jgi:hypothetical protein
MEKMRCGMDIWRVLRMVVLFAGANGGQVCAQEASFFGPNQGFEIQPEVDVYYRVSDNARLLLQLQDTAVPSTGSNSTFVGGFADGYVAPLVRKVLNPDEALVHALALRLGLVYTNTLAPGAAGSTQTLGIQFQATPRYFLPWSILLSNRNRILTRWTLGGGSFLFRYRGRLQVEREFPVGEVGLNPFVNAELFWQSPPSMWSQFRMQAGLQASVHWFGRGQTLEVNYSTITYLQPSRSWRPVLGIILYLYF